MRNLKRGCSGDDVKELQTKLGGLDVDGKFGKLTEAAVKEFQRNNPPLKVDGIAGRETQAALHMIDIADVSIPCDDLKQYTAPHGSMIYGPNSTYSTYKSGGCGVASFAIVHRAYGLAPEGEKATDTIQRLGRYSWEHGYRIKGGGTSAGLFGTNGCSYKSITRSASAIEDAIRGGALVILNIKKGFTTYTGTGHYIVAYGIKNGYLLLRDVGSSASARQKVKLSALPTGIKAAYKITKR